MSKKKPTQDLVPVGPKHVQKKYHGKRDENGLKPTTSRALILRNGKYGARGTGELVLAGRMTGREKLDLLAEDLVLQRSRSALLAPFKLDKCIKIADSQYNAYLDDIADLKDPEAFYGRIVTELITRSSRRAPDSRKSMRNPSHVASVVSTRIHNAYLVASGWKIVTDILRDLQNSGLNDAAARTQLQSDDSLRSRYLILCDVVGVLVDLGQAHFSILAMTTAHYSHYFKEVENIQPGEPSVAFDWASLKDACRSFLDSIIIELCFPKAPYPKRILYQILHDAIDESPREAKRFPQSMWDAVGDLSVSLELQELLESPLLGPEGEKLRTLARQMPEPYDKWLDAQIYSNRASELYASFKDLINPLERTKDPAVLNDMWGFINLNYKTTSGLTIDSLWQLDEALHRTPQWSSFYVPNLRTYGSDDDDDQALIPRLKGSRQKITGNKKQKKLLAIKSGRADDTDSDGSMPELQSVSDSSDENDDDIFVSESDEEEESDDDETTYDSEDEEFHRTMLREAMDAAMAIPEFFDPKSAVPEFDAMTEERKGNPFLKLLGSLRGRMFSSDPKLSSAKRTEPRKGIFGKKGEAATKTSAKATRASVASIKTPDVSKMPSVKLAPTKEPQPASAPEEPKYYRATAEDAEDEDEGSSVGGKKKKKKPKKKKKNKVANELPIVHEDSVPTVPTPTKSEAPSALTETPAKPPSTMSRASTASLNSNSAAHMSTSSLPIEPTVAQSAHSYLQEMGSPKEKVKSRPNHASLFSDKRGFLSKLGSKEKTKKEDEDDPTVNKKFTWFSKLGRKTTEYMHQLMRTNADEKVGSLKWDNFVKVMREMGFKYDPSTAGSSVRFDPPNPKDRSITIHKPHPDSTIQPYKLREIGRKLKEYYGWSEEDFLRRTSTA